MSKTARQKFYAVRNGYQVGIFQTWDECQSLVDGYPGADFSSFPTMEQAEDYLNSNKSRREITGASMAGQMTGKITVQMPSANMSLPVSADDDMPGRTPQPRKYPSIAEGKEITCQAQLEHVVFESADGTYNVAAYKAQLPEGERRIMATGIMLPKLKGFTYELTGVWQNHSKYGMQLHVSTYKDVVERSMDAITKYLSSGLIRGIGEATAKKIVEKFGEGTLDVMDSDIDRLKEVRGISAKKLEKIKKSYTANRQARDAIMLLGSKGIPSKIAVKAYGKFREQTMEIIQNRSYLLCLVRGITFPQADSLCENKTLDYEQSMERFKTCAKYVLFENENGRLRGLGGSATSGSIGMDKDSFGLVMYRLLNLGHLTPGWILDATISMIRSGEISYKHPEGANLIFQSGMMRIERDTANYIYQIAAAGVQPVRDLDRLIREAEYAENIHLAKAQYNAVKMAFEHNLSIIVGPPGTGKTTGIKVISYVFKKAFPGKKVIYMAPSGKAASRIKETTGEAAYTVHSKLGLGVDLIFDILPEPEEMIEDALVIVDEMSMLDSRTAYQMFAAIDPLCKVIICGDDEQLPSVNAGAVLRDMIDSGVIPVTELTEVYRQGKDCNIYINSFRIRRGETGLTYGKDFVFHEIDDTAEMQKQMVELYYEKVKEYGIDNVMLISPFKKHDAGVEALNETIQDHLNPASGHEEFTAEGKHFRVHDIVMQLKNDPDSGVVNGDVGQVIDIYMDDNEKTVSVEFPQGAVKEYTRENIDELTLAYAYTVHKSQGSEAKCVITCIHSMHSIMLKRNIFYTAITRAREEVHVFGQKSAMEQAIRTEDKTKRYTLLKTLLQLAFGKTVKI